MGNDNCFFSVRLPYYAWIEYFAIFRHYFNIMVVEMDGCILLDKILYTVNLYTVIWKNSYSIDRYSNRQLFHQTVIWTDSESKYRVYCRKGILYTGYSDRLPYENQVSCT